MRNCRCRLFRQRLTAPERSVEINAFRLSTEVGIEFEASILLFSDSVEGEDVFLEDLSTSTGQNSVVTKNTSSTVHAQGHPLLRLICKI